MLPAPPTAPPACEEVGRLPSQWRRQKSILARALKRVKEPRHEVVGQLPITASGVRPLSGVSIRGNGLDCLLAAVSVSVPVLLLGGRTVAPLRERDDPPGASAASGAVPLQWFR